MTNEEAKRKLIQMEAEARKLEKEGNETLRQMTILMHRENNKTQRALRNLRRRLWEQELR